VWVTDRAESATGSELRHPSLLPIGVGVTDLENTLLTWLPIIFFGVVIGLLLWTIRFMPRAKPAPVVRGSQVDVSWTDVAGLDEAKEELHEVVEFLRDRKRFEKLGARVPRGILLHGPPGTGKTLLAKAVASASGANFYSQSASSFVEMFAGLGAARIRKLFEEARKNAPAIVFIDELDAVGTARGGGGIHREHDQTLNQLLVELDGFNARDEVVVMAASNRLQDLDTALLRPGRFDRQVHVAPPDVAGREAILVVHTLSKPLAADVDLEQIARQTSGLTGADLANLCNEAAILAGRSGAQHIRHADFDAAMERIVAGLQQRRVVTEKEKRILAYHEAGHAVMSHLVGDLFPAQKATIVSRGQALGYTLNMPAEDRYLHTREEFVDLMMVFLAGRAAEQIVFGRITNGASNDLERVTQIARSMVFEYGMSEVAPSRTMRADNYALSEETKRLRDSEQARLTDHSYEEAQRLLMKHRSSLDRVAQALLDKETLDRAELEALLKDIKPESRSSETVGTVRALPLRD
jgi:cell division protease FtsH